MGWTFARWATKEAVAAECIGKGWATADGCKVEILAAEWRPEGDPGEWVYWAAARVERGPACQRENDHGTGFVICMLSRRERGAWGYKLMTEEEGPYYFSVPPAFLEMVPCPDSPHARKWRQKVKGEIPKRP